MITGHFGLAVGVKKIAPRLPLWSLLLASFWLDVIFTVFSLFGLESFAPMNPAQPMYGEVIINASYTHSLVGAIVFSHWILDLLVHRPDLPVLPGNLGNLPLLGLGLWQYPRLSGTIELVLVIGGAILYWVGAAKLKRDQRRRALAASVVTGTLMLILFVSNIFGL